MHTGTVKGVGGGAGPSKLSAADDGAAYATKLYVRVRCSSPTAGVRWQSGWPHGGHIRPFGRCRGCCRCIFVRAVYAPGRIRGVEAATANKRHLLGKP
eukprot:363882-Chlamydomonas_euryale.AAC.3